LRIEKKKKKTRNDRIVAVEQHNHSFADIKHVGDLGKDFLDELEEFFVNYHRMLGKQYQILGVRGPGKALRCIESGRRALISKNR
jgi:inorganic pyrophosphatase